MKRIIVALCLMAPTSVTSTLLMADTSTSPQAETLYVECHMTSQPSRPLASFYRQPPGANIRERYLSDILMADLAGWITPPPRTWVISPRMNTISSPEDIHFGIDNATIAEAGIHGYSREGARFFLNRITGEMHYTTYLDQEQLAGWQARHGATLPRENVWTYQCEAVRPRI
ncbi:MULTISPECIES: hypothetical protein [Halomonadaceae]|uniref:hypothetical protein n=1 Tax=Halomonadaceae TaxID=28256 RepID=UPI00159AC775|nr:MULTISPECIES: hypothetical protein [Halomonas]QJQ95254.1 hypothetical protein HIO72_08200 [Halomonas sp. PA5]